MKTQAVQVNEKNKEERQISGSRLNRPDHPRTIEEECLRKEPFFINHYYSHPVGQCCCQQQGMMVRRGGLGLGLANPNPNPNNSTV